MTAEHRRGGGCGARSTGRKQSHAGRRISYTVCYCRFIGAQHQDWFLGLFLFVHCAYPVGKFSAPHHRFPKKTPHVGIKQQGHRAIALCIRDGARGSPAPGAAR